MRPNMLVGAICVISAAAFAACQPSQSVDAAATAAATTPPAPLKLEAQPAPKPTPAKVQPKKAPAKAEAKTPAVSNSVVSMNTAAVNTAPASTPVMESHAVAARQDDLAIATTVTGCLELRNDGMFQLKDTDGDHAPKARSWRSGFIRKSSAKVDVLDAGNRLKLGNHVGSRVSLSGMLADRKLRARSLESTSERCE